MATGKVNMVDNLSEQWKASRWRDKTDRERIKEDQLAELNCIIRAVAPLDRWTTFKKN